MQEARGGSGAFRSTPCWPQESVLHTDWRLRTSDRGWHWHLGSRFLMNRSTPVTAPQPQLSPQSGARGVKGTRGKRRLEKDLGLTSLAAELTKRQIEGRRKLKAQQRGMPAPSGRQSQLCGNLLRGPRVGSGMPDTPGQSFPGRRAKGSEAAAPAAPQGVTAALPDTQGGPAYAGPAGRAQNLPGSKLPQGGQ